MCGCIQFLPQDCIFKNQLPQLVSVDLPCIRVCMRKCMYGVRGWGGGDAELCVERVWCLVCWCTRGNASSLCKRVGTGQAWCASGALCPYERHLLSEDMLGGGGGMHNDSFGCMRPCVCTKSLPTPDGVRISLPNSATILRQPHAPRLVACRAMASQSMTEIPCFCSNSTLAVDLPLAIPPVNPTTRILICKSQSAKHTSDDVEVSQACPRSAGCKQVMCGA